MKIEVPKSLFDYIEHLRWRAVVLNNDTRPFEFATEVITVQGPYGTYDLIAKEDKEFTTLIREETEEKIIIKHEIREYKK